MQLNNLSMLVPFRAQEGNEYRNTILEWMLRRLSAVFPEVEIIVEPGPLDGTFNGSVARNEAFKKSTRPYLAFVDSDTIFDRSTVENALEYLMQPGSTWSLPYNEFHVLDQESGKAILSSEVDIVLSEQTLSDELTLYDPPRNIDHGSPMCGLYMISADNYRKMGGFDERFFGWGFEDWAFRIAADNRVGPCQRFDAPVFHIWHPVKAKSTTDGPQYKPNQDLYNQYLHNFSRVFKQWV